MKTPLPFLLLTAIAMLSPALASRVEAETREASVQVILVRADSGDGGIDASLRPYASTLQRLFRFESYKQVGRTTLKMGVPGEDSSNLSGGQSITMRAIPAQMGVKADIDWKRGSQRLLHTRIQLRPGSPAILGGPRGKNGTWLLILRLH